MITLSLACAFASLTLVAAAGALADDGGESAPAAPAPAPLAGLDPAHPISLVTLLDEMTDRVRLAEFPQPPYVARLFSSYDRASTDPALDTWFANDDLGNVLRTIEREGRREGVLAEIDGPGSIVRIWSANPAGTLRFYLDGAQAPTFAVPMAEWLDGSGAVRPPLSAKRGRGSVSHLPIPFARGCVITCDQVENLYYHVSVRSYRAPTVVESFRPVDLQAHGAEIRAAGERLLDPALAYHYRSRVTRRIAPGEEAVLFDMTGSAAIAEVQLYMRADDLDRALRTTIFIGEFDGQRTVHCPLGDFFGSAPGINPYTSRAGTVAPDGKLTSRWFMPFADSGRVLARNVGDGAIELEGTVGSSQYEWGERSLHFHAHWRSECFPTRPRRVFEFATIEGRGTWVGDSLTVSNRDPRPWGAGDELIRVDGEAFPSHFGTGTEDYYGNASERADTRRRAPAWIKRFDSPFHGLTHLDESGYRGFTSHYRWRALDAIPFERSLRFELQVGHSADTQVCYMGTSFFYAEPGSCNVEAIVDPARLVVPVYGVKCFRRPGALEGESLAVERCDDGVVIAGQGIGDDASWSGMSHLFAKPSALGESVAFTVRVARPGRHEVVAWLTQGDEYGKLAFRVNGAEAGSTFDGYCAGREPSGPVAHSLGVHDLHGRSFTLAVTVTGSNEAARRSGLLWGLDCIELRAQAAGE